MRRLGRIADDRIGAHGTDAFATVQLRAAWTISEDLMARAGIDNATDVAAVEHGSAYHLPGFARRAFRADRRARGGSGRNPPGCDATFDAAEPSHRRTGGARAAATRSCSTIQRSPLRRLLQPFNIKISG